MVDLRWPVVGRITQHFGERPEYYAQWGYPGHPALDLAAPVGTPVYAAHDGLLRHGHKSETLGNFCRIEAPWGYTQYAHLDRFTSPTGPVQAGQEIGRVGMTGNTTGPHLDFALYLKAMQHNAWGGRVDPLPYLERGEVRLSKASLHWQRMAPWLREAHAALGSGWIKVVNPPEGPDPAPGLSKLLRFWTDDWDRDYLRRGSGGALDYLIREMDRWSRYQHWGHVVFELPNEPGCNSNEDLAMLAAFTATAVNFAHDNGFEVCVLNLPEGNPHDNGTGNPDVARWKMQQLAPALVNADYLGLHGYWSPLVEGPNGENHALRYRQNHDYIVETIGYCPPILLNECGCDGGVGGRAYQKGWRDLYPNRAPYIVDAAQFMEQVELDDCVEQAFFFTAGYEEPWGGFDHDRETVLMMAWMFQDIPGQVRPSPDNPGQSAGVGEQIGELAQYHIVPLNPGAALEKAAADLGLMSAGDEFDAEVDGVTFRAQPFRSPGERDWQYIAYCRVGDWGNVKWHRRRN